MQAQAHGGETQSADSDLVRRELIPSSGQASTTSANHTDQQGGPVPMGAGGAGIALTSCGRSVTAHLCLRVTNHRSFPWRTAVEGAPSGQDIYLGAPEADF